MNKLKSRKFLVWLCWLAITIVALFRSDLPKETIFEFFGFVSLTYIGGNVAQDWVVSKKTPSLEK